MIKFFRKIRQKVLSENRFSKYLIYAIGEIVLVVIGILIAVQINNWNEYNKQQKEEQRILINLKTDIVKDTLKLHYNIKETIKRDSALTGIIKLLAPKNGHNKRKFIQLSLFNIAFANFFEVNSGTFDESIASGSIKYITNDSLRQHIFDYYRETKLNLNDKVNFNNSNRDLEVLFKKVMTTKDILAVFGEESRLPELDLILLGKDIEFMSLITEKITTHNQQRVSWEKYMNNAKKLYYLIENELESD